MKGSQHDPGGRFRQPSIAWLVLLSLLTGCGDRPRPVHEPMHGPFGPPVASTLLAPLQGTWRFDPDKTLQARKAAGADDAEIERLRKSYEARQQSDLHAELTIRDNEALGSPFPFSEYRFFHLHRHGGTVCGKAWHHEDRFDPGDMSKCYVQLTIVGDCLHFRCRMTEGLPDLNDPDLSSPLPVDLDSSVKCEAGKAAEGWGELMVFVRAAAK